MKLKFIPVALMLLLGLNACDTYDESSSVANMRNGKAELFKSEAAVNLATATLEEANAALKNAEAAYKTFEAALKETEVIAAQLANAKLEADNEFAIAKLQREEDLAIIEMVNEKLKLANALTLLENAKLVNDGAKLTAENTFFETAADLVASKDSYLNASFGFYTNAYSAWDFATSTLLDAKRLLITTKFALASAQYDFDNVDAEANQTVVLAGLNAENDAFVASLAVVNALKTTNDWDAFIDAKDALEVDKTTAEAAKSTLETIQTNVNNADVMATAAVAAAALAVSTDAATAYTTAEADASEATGAAYAAIMDWKVTNPNGQIRYDLGGIYEYQLAMQNGLDAAELVTANALSAKAAKLAAIALAVGNVDLLAQLNEELILISAVYDTKKAISDGFVVAFAADVAAKNAALAADQAAAAAALATSDAAAADYTVAALAASDATDAEAAAIQVYTDEITVIDVEIARLNALEFVYKTSTEVTTSAILSNMAGNIDTAIATLETSIETKEAAIFTAEKTLAAIVAGDYSQAIAVTDQELIVVKAEANIVDLELLVAEAKANLDNTKAAYEALLED